MRTIHKPLARSVTPQRNVGRVSRGRTVAAAAQMGKEAAVPILNRSLQLIAKLNAEIAEIAQSIAEQEALIEKTLIDAKMQGHTNGVMSAQLKDVYSRESLDIEPEVLRDALAGDDEKFYSCVKVSITELRKIMTEKEMRDIGVASEVKKTGTVLKIEAVKHKIVKK